jgi:hypothetical protein
MHKIGGKNEEGVGRDKRGTRYRGLTNKGGELEGSSYGGERVDG